MKLQYKILLAPAVTLGFLAIFGAVALTSMISQRAALNEIYVERFGDFEFAARTASTLDSAHAKTFRLMTWTQVIGPEKAKAATAEILGTLDSTLRELDGASQSKERSEEARKVYASILPLVKTYRKQVADAIDLGSADANMGLSMMQSAQESYDRIDHQIELLVKSVRENAGKSFESASGGFNRTLVISVAALALAIAAGLAVSLLLGRQIMKPLREAGESATRIASGDLTAEVGASTRDEIGDLLRSLETMRVNLKDMIASISVSADSVNGATRQLAGSADRAASASQQQSDNAASMAAAVEELTVSVNQMAENAKQAHQLSVDSGEVSRRGGEVIRRTLDEMKGIDHSVSEAATTVSELGQQSAQISRVVGVIKEIADQTNLLALNAAIEAARAGEQGRGFAVVADEVRKLAERTTQSTEEIRQMVSRIQGDARNAVAGIDKAVAAVKSGVGLAESAGESTRQITERAEAMVREIASISAALKEQGAAGNDIAMSVEKIVRMTEETSSAAGSAAALARDLQGLAETMHGQVGRFKV